jgi:hypothetical protein
MMIDSPEIKDPMGDLIISQKVLDQIWAIKNREFPIPASRVKS